MADAEQIPSPAAPAISPELRALAECLKIIAPGVKIDTAVLALQMERMLLKRGMVIASQDRFDASAKAGFDAGWNAAMMEMADGMLPSNDDRRGEPASDAGA